MSKLIKAARQAREELQNARDHIWLLPEKAQPLTEKQILKKLQAAISVVSQAIAEAEDAVAAEREACAQLLENGRFLHDEAPAAILAKEAAKAIRARGDASDMSQERVAEKAKDKHKWVGLTEEELCKTVLANLDETLWTLTKVIEAKLKAKNAA